MATTQKIRKYPKAGTIGSIVLAVLQKDTNPDLDGLTKTILKKFPDSKFNKAHLAWYKHQVKRGNFVLLNDTDQKPAAKKPSKKRAAAKASK